MRLAAIGVLLAAAIPSAASVLGDSAQGAKLFQEQKCVTCHSVRGEGGKAAPDLGRRSGRAWTPASFAALLWNHAPSMWSAMERAGIEKPQLGEQASADLFAYFFAARAFDPPGDAGRGRRFFVEKGCADCHNLTSPSAAGGTPVMRWASLADVIEVSRQMWNHAPQMREAAARQNRKVPVLTAAQMNDILVYLRSLPQVRGIAPQFSPAAADTGERLFALKGCTACHGEGKALAKGKGVRTAAELAVSMWNHATFMKQSPEILPEEMRRLVGYLWNRQFELEAGDWGDAQRGQRVFASKGCAGCHQPEPPKLPTAYSMVAALWSHGPAMKKEMESRNIAWPRLTEREMRDLLAHLR